MSHEAPGLLSDGDPVDRERARTEVLASAFDEAAGNYFQRLTRYEDNISDAEERKERMKYLAAGGVAVAVLALVVFGAGVVRSVALPVVGVLVAVAIGAYAYREHQAAEEKIEENETNIATNEPDGEVSFVSRIGVPMYLVPYEQRHMVFDGLNLAPATDLELANIDGDTLVAQGQELNELKAQYDELLGGETVVSPDLLAEFAPEAATHRQLERPLLDHFDRMTQVADDIERDTIRANVCADDQKSRSVAQLAADGLLSRGDLRTIETRQSMAECEAVVDRIRGVEEQAVSGDMLDQAQKSRERVDEIASELGSQLQANVDRVDEHYTEHAEEVAAASSKQVCQECLHSRVEEVSDELGLVDQILSSETGSLGIALKDEDLDKGADGAFTERIRNDIEDAVPAMDRTLERAYNQLTDLGGVGEVDTAYCEVHGEVETERVADSGALFGEVWRSLYYTFREPIMESAEELEQEAENIRQTKEQKMVDLTQYEQIKDQAEQRYSEIESDYETARNIERELR